MAIERIYGGLWIPAPVPFNTATPSFTSMLIDASGEKVALIIQVPRTGTLDQFEFRIGSSIQLPTNGLKCSFQDVSLTTGDPDGTIDQYRVVTGLSANSWVIPGLMTSDGTDGGTKRNVARGDLLACVIEFQSFNLLDVVNVSALDLSSTAFMGSPPYSDHFTLSWAKQKNGLVMALKYDDGVVEQIMGGNCYPIKNLLSQSYNDDSVRNRFGLAFSVPTPVLLGGIYVHAALPVDTALELYDPQGFPDGSGIGLLETVTLDTNVQVDTTRHYHTIRFRQDHRLRGNEFYGAILWTNSVDAGAEITLSKFEIDRADLMNAADGGQNFYMRRGLAIQINTWEDILTERPWMGLIITGIDHDTSGGSSGPGFEGVP